MAPRRSHIFDEINQGLRRGINPFVHSLEASRRDATYPALYGKALRPHVGNWKGYFTERLLTRRSPEKVVLEIGMHKGRSLLAMAEERPSWGFVGMDITYKRVVTTAERVIAAGHRNVLAILGDARYVGELFSPGELGGIMVFFPDPWTKKQRQSHHRLLSPEFLQSIVPLLEAGGFFWLKTDSERYFSEVARSMETIPGMAASSEAPLKLSNHLTTFEAKFTAQGLPIYEGIWRRLG